MPGVVLAQWTTMDRTRTRLVPCGSANRELVFRCPRMAATSSRPGTGCALRTEGREFGCEPPGLSSVRAGGMPSPTFRSGERVDAVVGDDVKTVTALHDEGHAESSTMKATTRRSRSSAPRTSSTDAAMSARTPSSRRRRGYAPVERRRAALRRRCVAGRQVSALQRVRSGGIAGGAICGPSSSDIAPFGCRPAPTSLESGYATSSRRLTVGLSAEHDRIGGRRWTGWALH